MLRIHHTPGRRCGPRPLALTLLLALLAGGSARPVRGQQGPAILDALSVTLSGAPARAALRLRVASGTAGIGWSASGVVTRPGRRITAELLTDTLGTLRSYTAETRDSTGVVVDRVHVVNAGGRITLERTTPRRRQVREYAATPGLILVDADALVPLLVLARRIQRPGPIPLLDVRGPAMRTATSATTGAVQVQIADAPVTGTAWTLDGIGALAGWWTDASGRLLAALLAPGVRLQRDDPPM